MKIYLSPSSQWANDYKGVKTNEAEQCQRIARCAEKYLKLYGFEVKVGDNNKLSCSGRRKESNSWKADLHVPIHTNASGTSNPTATGAMVLCYGASKDNAYVKNMYEDLQKMTGRKGRGISVRNDLDEVIYTNAVCVYVEAEYHDKPDMAKWIIDNVDLIGKTIADSIKRTTDENVSAEKKEEPRPESGKEDGVLYCVQTGAYKVYDNAVKRKNELKAMGIDCFIAKKEVKQNAKVQG